MNSLDPRVEKSLRDAHGSLELRGELLSAERMQASYAAFRSPFGPDVLKSLDGLALRATESETTGQCVRAFPAVTPSWLCNSTPINKKEAFCALLVAALSASLLKHRMGL